MLEPADPIAGMRFVDHIRLHRPHFLDGDMRYLFARPGNRAALFTLVSRDRQSRFQADMQRQVYLWNDRVLPERPDLEEFFELDGVLIDVPIATGALHAWQDRIAPRADELPHVCFSRLDLQKRWLALTAADDYANGVMDYISG